jgi:hypothetical protein
MNFVMETTMSNRTKYTVDQDVVDPAGEGRKRQIARRDAKYGIAGAISWLPKRKNAKIGLVKLKTDFGQATLVL